ncbi:MAG: MFS transporter [Pyrinomonadaceae bacterium]
MTSRNDTNQYLILFALWLLVFSASSQIMILSPMLPQIARELDLPAIGLGSFISVYALMVGVFGLATGPVSDKIGRRRVLLVGAGVMTGALALHAAAVDYASLLCVRALAGAAGGVLSGAAVSYVGDYFPYERRGWAMGWVMSSTALGQILGVPAGTLLAERYGFRTPFLMFALTMALTFVAIWRFVPQPNIERSQNALTLNNALRQYLVLLRRPEVIAAAGVYTLMFASLALFVIYFPTWLVNERGFTASHIAVLFFVGGVANAATGPLAGGLSDRIGRKRLIVACCFALAMVMLATTALVKTQWAAYPLFFVIMILVAARMSPVQALLSGLTRGTERGSLMSLTIALGQTGFAVAGAVSGIIYTRYGYGGNTIVAAICVILMALLVWRYLPEPQPEAQRQNTGGDAGRCVVDDAIDITT